MLAGCGDAPPSTARAIKPFPTPSPTEPPLPELVPVVGAVLATGLDGTDPRRLGLRGDTDVEQDEVDEASAQVGTLLDAYLDSVQTGAPDTALLGAPWLEQAPEARDALQGLANRENPVETATYRATVEVEDGPALVAVELIVTLFDGSVREARLVFDVTGDAPVLLLVETEVPA